MEALTEIDWAQYQPNQYEEVIKRKICEIELKRFSIKNIFVDGNGYGLDFFNELSSTIFEETGYYVNCFIDGAGKVKNSRSLAKIDEDELNGFYTATYYPIEDKLIAVMHFNELI